MIFNPLPLFSTSIPSPHLFLHPSVLDFTCTLQQHLGPASPACLLNLSLCTHFGLFPKPCLVGRETTLRASLSQKSAILIRGAQSLVQVYMNSIPCVPGENSVASSPLLSDGLHSSNGQGSGKCGALLFSQMRKL